MNCSCSIEGNISGSVDIWLGIASLFLEWTDIHAVDIQWKPKVSCLTG